MSFSEHAFFRLEKNYLTRQGIYSQDEIERKRLIEDLFIKKSSIADSNINGPGMSETTETEKKTFLKAIVCPGFKLTTEEQPLSPFPRIILRIPLESRLLDLFNTRVKPTTVSWISSVLKKPKLENIESGGPTSSTSPSNKKPRSQVIPETDIPAHQTAIGCPEEKLEENYIIRQITFSDSSASVNLTILKSLQNADWTSNGKFIVLCGKQGLLLGDVASATFVTSTSGEYNRVSCHPTLPLVFASLLASSSLITYEITARTNGKPGQLSYAMKITAEMKFTSVKLSSAVLSWSPLGNMLIICSNERGLYLLAFEEVTSVNGRPTQSDSASLTVLHQFNTRVQRPRRVLRIIGQGRFGSRITAAAFRCVYKNAHYSIPESLLNPSVEKLITEEIQVSNLLLCVTLENGQFWTCPIESTTKCIQENSTVSHKNLSQHSIQLNPGFEITCFDVDPLSGRFIALGGADHSLHIMDGTSGVMVGAHYRVGAPMEHIAVSAGGLMIAWSPQFPISSANRVNDLLDSSRSSQSFPCVCISRVGPSLEFLWKTDVTANITCLRWHPWLPALLVVCDSNTRLSSSYHNVSGSTRESYSTNPSQQSANAVMIFYFA